MTCSAIERAALAFATQELTKSYIEFGRMNEQVFLLLADDPDAGLDIAGRFDQLSGKSLFGIIAILEGLLNATQAS